MSRLSIRPRPLDIHKKLPIVKSVKDFEDDDTPTTSATRSSQLLRIAESDIIVNYNNNNNHEITPVPAKKFAAEIPTPQFVVVDTYERDYSRTFGQPTSYLRGRGARAELGEFVEYDLDNEDEDWLEEFNNDKKILSPERLESILFKLEVLDYKARERAGLLTPTFGAPIPVHLQHEAAFEALQAQGIKYSLFQSVYYFWKDKRERWQKPILRRLQPPPPVNDTNPYNVFRPREKAHRQHTRRMQRRENNVQSFEKLRQVRRNLEQAKVILEALIKREESKREAMETEVSLQRVHLKYKHEVELLDDNLGVANFSSKFGSSEEDFMDSDDVANVHPHSRAAPHHPHGHHAFTDSNLVMMPTTAAAANVKQEFRRRHMAPPNHRWLQRMDPLEPILLFTKPLVPEKLAAAGIIPPSSDFPAKKGGAVGSISSQPPPPRFRGRIGRGGRIIFDRWNPLSQSPINLGNSSLYVLPPKPQTSSMYN